MNQSSTPESVRFLRERLTRAPRVVLILGSGLAGVADEVTDPVSIPYGDIPGFPITTVGGHRGELVVGVWEGVEIAVMRGRFHLYEGWSAEAVALPLRAFAALGAEYLIVTNASGGIRAGLEPGALMLIADHLNFMFRNPLIGPAVAGEDRFPDMSEPYDGELRSIARKAAEEIGIALVPGVFAGVLGPSYETPAEIDALRFLGADAVGMSTVPEVLVARALGMRVLGISCIANLAAGGTGAKLTHEEVLAVGQAAGQRVALLLRAFLPKAIPRNS